MVAYFGFITIKNSYYRADTDGVSLTSNSGLLNISAELTKEGKVLIDGKESQEKYDFVNNELRMLVLDNPGKYFEEVNVTLRLPEGISGEVFHEILGVHGVAEKSSHLVDKRTVVYQANEVSSSAILTIVAKLPAGSIKPKIAERITKNLLLIKSKVWILVGISLPALCFIIMVMFLIYQQRRHRIEIPEKETANPPMAIPPAVVGALFNQKVGSREIAATLIDLAQRGDIVILDRDRGFAFGKGRFDQRLLGFEKILLSKIFSEHLSSDRKELEERINRHFYSKKMSLVTAGIYALATRLGYFKANPQKYLMKYRLLGIFFFLIALGGFAISLIQFRDPPFIVFFWVGMMATSLIISIMAGKLPIRTVIGQEVLSNWYAFKKYLSNPNSFPYSENNQEIFQKYLPYAIVMNCEAAWAKRFSEHNFMMPDWFLSDKKGLGLEDFCLSLFPIVSYVSRSLSAIREPGFE